MAGVGSEGALGSAGMAQAIRQMIVDRLTQAQAAQEMKLRDQDMNLRERQFQSNEELKRAQLASLENERQANVDLRRQNAAHLARQSFTEEHLPGDVLPPDEAAQGRQVGVNIEHQGATLPSTQDQGGVTMPMLRGRVVMPSGATSGEQGTASSGAATSTAKPGNPEQDVYRGNAAQREADKKERLLQGYIRKLDPNSPLGQATAYEQATGRNAPAGVFRPSLDQIGQEAEARAKAGAKYRQAPTVVIQTTDASGNPVSRIVPKTAGSEFAAKPTTQALDAARTNKEAQDTLNQLDQSIENAKDLIGPGEGRVSNVEQMIGSADPRIQALGVKMKAAKMRVDHAITGSVRAGASPYLLQQWDNILANKITPEGLKAGVQAMREIVGGGTSSTASGTVKMKAPNGQVSNVPADQVEHFKAKGAVVVQ